MSPPPPWTFQVPALMAWLPAVGPPTSAQVQPPGQAVDGAPAATATPSKPTAFTADVWWADTARPASMAPLTLSVTVVPGSQTQVVPSVEA